MKEDKSRMEKHFSTIAGAPVALTIRGDRQYTFSTEDRNDAAAQKIVAFFAGQAEATVEHDEECGSFVYVNVPAE